MGAFLLAALLSQAAPDAGAVEDALTPQKAAAMSWRELVKAAPDSMLVEEADVRLAAKVREGKKLSKLERQVELVRRFSEEVLEAGLDGYFGDEAGNDAAETLKALKAMKVNAWAAVLSKAIAVFQGKIPKDPEARAKYLENLYPESREGFEAAETAFDNDYDEAERQLAAFLRKAKLDLAPAPRS